MVLPIKSDKNILALGSEFDTRLAFFCDGEIIFSKNTGETAEQPERLEKFILDFLKDRKVDIIITDLHPLYSSHQIGEKLAKNLRVEHIEVQHHIAHIFSAVADYVIVNTKYKILDTDFYGIACDGTGYGLDGNIWGGEVFRVSNFIMSPRINAKMASLPEQKKSHNFVHTAPRELTRKNSVLIQRIGHLEEQYLLGGELAVEEPARMLISILSKFLSKKDVFKYVKKYYSENEFNLLWNQLEQKFNCPISTSTARVLDAVSILLGFCDNERNYKHYAVKMLEKNTNMRIMQIYEWQQIKPEIKKNELGEYVLNTTELFKWLIQNTRCDKEELGFAAQRYIIEGLYEIVKRYESERKPPPAPLLIKEGKLKSASSFPKVFFSGGLAGNKVMSDFARNNNIYVSKEIPSGDEGIAFGQIMYYVIV